MSNIIDFVDHKRPIWLLDKKTAMYIINMATEVENGHRFYFEECPYCGGQYIAKLGHRCEDTLEIKCDVPDDKIVRFLGNE